MEEDVEQMHRKDAVQIVSGVRNGYTGSPITIVVTNDDFTHWRNIMGVEPITAKEQQEMKRTITKPRPGHADLIGGKRNIIIEEKCLRAFFCKRNSCTRSCRCSM